MLVLFVWEILLAVIDLYHLAIHKWHTDLWDMNVQQNAPRDEITAQ